jgi:hypothetical protein
MANKLRIDLRDLDGAIEQAKGGLSGPDDHRRGGTCRPRGVPRQLAPVRNRTKWVTPPVTAISTVENGAIRRRNPAMTGEDRMESPVLGHS